MKNKDKYDLSSLSVNISYLTDGCGKKADNLRYISIKHENKVIFSETVADKPMEAILQWLEQE